MLGNQQQSFVDTALPICHTFPAMNTNLPELILSLRGLSGMARSSVSEQIQRLLTRLGYDHPNGLDIDAEVIVISEWEVTYTKGFVVTTVPSVFFDHLQIDDFLHGVKVHNAKLNETIIEITVTPPRRRRRKNFGT